MLRPALLCAVLACSAGCASLRPIPPSALSQSAVVAPLGVEFILTSLRHDVSGAFLVPVDSAGRLETDRPIAQSYVKDGQVYFLDLPPGRYALTALSFSGRGLKFTARLTREEALGTVVTAGAGEVAFMGDVVLKRQWQGWKRFVSNGARGLSRILHPFRPSVVPIASFLKIHDRSSKAEVRALQAALKHLAGTEWAPMVQRRLKSIHLIPELPREGLLWNRRPVAPRQLERFSYVDTLEWGQPWTVPGGLEWRHPKGEARIQLRFVTGPEAAQRPAEAYLRRLKELGSPEDDHILSSLVISSRTASAVRYTTYHYPEPYLVGSVVRVSMTETAVVEDPEGYFVLQFRCAREGFSRLYPEFARFRSYLVLKRGVVRREEEP